MHKKYKDRSSKIFIWSGAGIYGWPLSNTVTNTDSDYWDYWDNGIRNIFYSHFYVNMQFTATILQMPL